MKIISFMNQKGGSGKTTGAREIAGLLAKKNTILLIDCDFQRNLTGSFAAAPKETIFDFFNKNCKIQDCIINVNPNVDLIPGDVNLRNIDSTLNFDLTSFTLKKELDQLDYDYIIIDCHPAMGIVEKNALVGSDFLISPIEAHYFSLDGLEILEKYLEEMRNSLKPNFKNLVYFNRISRGNVPGQVMKIIKEARPVLNNFIRDTVKLKECSMAGEFIINYSPKSNGAKDFKKLLEEVKTYGI